MAPEQFRDAKNADVKCDVYSLGATLYMLLTGQVPFANSTPLDCWLKKRVNEFPSPREVVPSITRRVEWAVKRAMSGDPACRPATCREFMEDLYGRAWRSNSPSDTEAPPSITPSPDVDLWYLVYRDADNKPRTVKGSTDSIRKNFVEGTLGDQSGILVSRLKTGPFNLLKSIPEFRDLVIQPAPAPNLGTGKVGPATPTPTPSTAKGPTVRLARTPSRPAGDPNAEIPTEPYRVVPVVGDKKQVCPALVASPTPVETRPAPPPKRLAKPQFALWIGGVVLLAVLIAAAVYVLIP
jgi:serine/threonine protein kinase